MQTILSEEQMKLLDFHNIEYKQFIDDEKPTYPRIKRQIKRYGLSPKVAWNADNSILLLAWLNLHQSQHQELAEQITYVLNYEYYTNDKNFLDVEMQVLEATIIKMESRDCGVHGAVFYITEPEIKEKSITIEDVAKLSSDIVFIYQEKPGTSTKAYATKPTDEMRQTVRDDFDIDDVEVLPKSMYSIQVDRLSVDCSHGLIEAYFK